MPKARLASSRAPLLIRGALFGAALWVFMPDVAAAQDTVVLARIAVKDGATYRFAEVFHESGNWVFPDVGYVDYGDTNYREFFAGFGRTFVKSAKVTIVGEVYYLQAAGSASGAAKYALPWGLIKYQPSPRIRAEVVYFPYLPLTRSAALQHVIERSKLEYSWTRFKVGGGYGAYQLSGSDWHHKPFVTLTVTPPAIGDVEVWLQRASHGGVQFQLRYHRVVK